MSRHSLTPLQSRVQNRLLPIVLGLGAMLPSLIKGLIGEGIKLFLSEVLRLPPPFIAPLTSLVSIGLVIIIILFLLSLTPVSGWFGRIFRLNEPQALPKPVVNTLTESFRGLIVFASRTPCDRVTGQPTGQPTPAESAILRHLNLAHPPQLQHCWLICTNESIAEAQALKQRLEAAGHTNLKLHFEMGRRLPDPRNPGQTLSLFIEQPEQANNSEYVKRVIDEVYLEAAQMGIPESEIIADFTGGNKAMTAGIILACIKPGRRMEYFSQLQADRDAKTDLKEIWLEYDLKNGE